MGGDDGHNLGHHNPYIGGAPSCIHILHTAIDVSVNAPYKYHALGVRRIRDLYGGLPFRDRSPARRRRLFEDAKIDSAASRTDRQLKRGRDGDIRYIHSIIPMSIVQLNRTSPMSHHILQSSPTLFIAQRMYVL